MRSAYWILKHAKVRSEQIPLNPELQFQLYGADIKSRLRKIVRGVNLQVFKRRVGGGLITVSVEGKKTRIETV